jgi:oligoribonuclease NrnB/cAMP/cGMP phosphodiesterase (DHH superfamily)
MAIKVLFHSFGNGKHCPDGFAAAYAAWKLFGDDAEYVPCVYQQEPPTKLERGDSIYLVDFSYPREQLLKMAQTAHIVAILDHHKTAQSELEGWPCACFDMNRSGAELAWQYFHPTWERFVRGEAKEEGLTVRRTAPDLIRYVADRDLWKKKLPFTEEVHLALGSFPKDFQTWDTLANLTDYVGVMRAIGAPLLQERTDSINELVASATWGDLDGQRALCTNTTNYGLVSDALNVICKNNPDTPFAFNYSQADEGGTKYELRSVGDFDVSAVAKRLGGGGHKNAAGCLVK